uniref:Uncharacterized protein n=1 Tax=Thermofilum adornatum TaxID=1365176 RepID=A0A7C1CDZ7_9CREN
MRKNSIQGDLQIYLFLFLREYTLDAKMMQSNETDSYKEVILQELLKRTSLALLGEDIKVAVKMLKASLIGNKISFNKDTILEVAKQLGLTPSLREIKSARPDLPTTYWAFFTIRDKSVIIKIEQTDTPLVSNHLKITCKSSGTFGSYFLDFYDFISNLIAKGIFVFDRDNPKEVLVKDPERYRKILDALENEISGKLIIPEENIFLPEPILYKRWAFYYFLKKGDTLIRLERIGKTLEYVIKRIVIIPQDIVRDSELILEVFISATEESGALWVGITPRWYSIHRFLNPCESSWSSMASYEEIKKYQISFEDKITLDNELEKILLRTAKGMYKEFLLKSGLFRLSSTKPNNKQGTNIHQEVQELLANLGRELELQSITEYTLGNTRIDVAWLDKGLLKFAFEIVIEGSILEALYRLQNVNAEKKILIVKDDRLKEAEGKAPNEIKIIPLSYLYNRSKIDLIRHLLL